MAPRGRAYLNITGLGDEGEELVRGSDGAANDKRLLALKTRYDPTNPFRLNQNFKPAA